MANNKITMDVCNVMVFRVHCEHLDLLNPDGNSREAGKKSDK